MRGKWSKQDEEVLKTFYAKDGSKKCQEELKGYRSIEAIKAKASGLCLTSEYYNKWNTEEDDQLKDFWVTGSMEDLLKTFPKRTYTSLMLRAQSLGIKSTLKRKRKGDLSFLNSSSKNANYWWGFIIADGHLAENGALIVSISSKDKDHLLKLSILLKCKIITRESPPNKFNSNFYSYITLRVGDIRFAEKWRRLLHINKAKTYYPPDLSFFFTKEKLLPFFIGLVDGDGCIWLTNKTWPNIRIELHKNWKLTLEKIAKYLFLFYGIEAKVKTTKRDTSKIEINTKKCVSFLFENKHGTDFMERKWNKLENI